MEVRGLELSLESAAGRVDILRGIDFTVARGEAVGVLGPSGSGKSSLLSVVAGLERPTGGTVSVLGQPLADLDEDALAQFRSQRLGVVFQAFHLIPTMTVLENAALPLELANAPGAFDLAADQLRAVGLGDKLDRFPHQLSGGEQQRAAVARAVVHDPALLLADEPTGSLDRASGARVADLLFALQAERGAAMVLITHDAGLAGRCARIVEMADGRIAETAAAAAAIPAE
ncbi:MAG: ATP-binding cassette domain-containing protein [Pseudomonadota bacterium]